MSDFAAALGLHSSALQDLYTAVRPEILHIAI